MRTFTFTDLLLSLLRPKMDWFIVESRYCFAERLCQAAFDEDFGFGIVLPNKYGLTIRYTTGNSATLRDKDGETILIGQTVFESFEAAQVHFQNLSRLYASGDDYQKVYLWRLVAKSRYGAVTMPPEKYSVKDGVLLRTFPEVGWHKPAV